MLPSGELASLGDVFENRDIRAVVESPHPKRERG